jgi:hypothetical protein
MEISLRTLPKCLNNWMTYFRNFKLKHLLVLPIISVTGCFSDSDRVEMRSLAPAASAKKVIAELDTNGDGKIDRSESRPSLTVLLDHGDTNSDQMLDEAEIRARLKFHESERVAILTTGIYLKSRNRPVAGVDVRLVPDPVFENLAVATGTSDKFGHVEFTVEGESLPGVYCGLYSIEVVKGGKTKTLSVGLEVGQASDPGDKVIRMN